MQSVIAGLSPQRYARHALHDPGRDWPETNCYVDLWIEALHARGLEPRAGLGFTCELDFEGDQFTFFKFPPEDMARLFGARVFELSIFDRIEVHLAEQIARGRMALVEVDAFFLPDTRGVSFGLEHSKTTIGVNGLDATARRLQYFHNSGLFELEGSHFDGVFQRAHAPGAGSEHLFPYVEFVKFDQQTLSGDALREAAQTLLRAHLAGSPELNPIVAFAARVEEQAAAVSVREPAFFHKYAFNTLRQAGASFELLGAHLEWLDASAFAAATASARALSASAKAFQFQLARATSRKKVEGLAKLLEPMAEHWGAAMHELRMALA